MADKCCKNCAWAQFERTPKGKITRNVAGRCTCPGPDFSTFPQSTWEGQCSEDPDGRPPIVARHAIWPDFGKKCPLFKQRK